MKGRVWDVYGYKYQTNNKYESVVENVSRKNRAEGLKPTNSGHACHIYIYIYIYIYIVGYRSLMSAQSHLC